MISYCLTWRFSYFIYSYYSYFLSSGFSGTYFFYSGSSSICTSALRGELRGSLILMKGCEFLCCVFS